MRPTTLFTAALSLSSLAAAWPWPYNYKVGKSVREIEGVLFKRQDNSQSSSTPTTTRAQSSSQNSNSASRTVSGSSTITAGPSTSGSLSSGNGTDDSSSYSTEYDPRLPAGGVSMITPNPLQGSVYYKIGDWVTFAWNYTSVSSLPTAVNVLASCSANSATYTLASNLSVAETNKVYWDTNEYAATASVPLLTNQYTLIIMDAAGSISETPRAGYLAVQRTYQFGMYLKQSYTPWSDYNCATCNGAFSIHEKQALSVLLGTATLTVLSFGWFASGFGVF